MHALCLNCMHSSLNCMHSAPFYAAAADILLVDPYPIGIDPTGCTEWYGCCLPLLHAAACCCLLLLAQLVGPLV